jgi:hypothetical protein
MNRSLRYLLFALLMLVSLRPLCAQVAITVSFGPPALPVYEQPLCPAEGYIWTPGYWAWDQDYGDYYWVPGTWVLAPETGFLWTPGWWGWGGNGFLFHEGYWGPQVGFYGGINYGFGYFGHGYEGGRWDGGHFFYNRSVNNVNVVNIHNVYNTTIVNRETVNRVSYNGGNGGIQARPTPAEEAAERGRHIPPIATQTQHVQMARTNPQLRASVNQGKPPIAATERPAAFSGPHVMAAKEAGAPYHPPANRPVANRGEASTGNPARPGEVQPHSGAARPEAPHSGATPPNAANPAHASELQPHQVATPPSTGNAKLDQKYQQQQQKLVAKQNLEHQQLQQRQEQEHQRATQQNFAQAQQQQMEQRHQQQTQQMEQRHTQQMQSLQTRQAGPGGGRPPR